MRPSYGDALDAACPHRDGHIHNVLYKTGQSKQGSMKSGGKRQMYLCDIQNAHTYIYLSMHASVCVCVFTFHWCFTALSKRKPSGRTCLYVLKRRERTDSLSEGTLSLVLYASLSSSTKDLYIEAHQKSRCHYQQLT